MTCKKGGERVWESGREKDRREGRGMKVRGMRR